MKKILIVTAHPDDETLWFSSVALRNTADLICVTCGYNSETRKKRKRELEMAAKLLGLNSLTILNYDDVFMHRIDISRLEKDLSPYVKKKYSAVYTHGPYGDTNEHYHHQDINYVVNKLFKNVFCTAWNLYPDIVNQLSTSEYYLKKHIMGTVYHDEFRKLKTTYEISSVEKFVRISPVSSEIYYWSIANFGDHHQMLGSKYKDIWGYRDSPYEIERHSAIEKLARSVTPKKILEIGSSEGILTERLACIASVDCVEKARVYQRTLKDKGFKLKKSYSTKEYDLIIVASVLEYMKKPRSFLKMIKSNHIIVETISTKHMAEIVSVLGENFKLIETIEINPRWEKMYHDHQKEKLEVYRLGCHVYLYEKKA